MLFGEKHVCESCGTRVLAKYLTVGGYCPACAVGAVEPPPNPLPEMKSALVGKLSVQRKPTAEYEGGYRDGQRTDLLQGSPLRVARMRGGVEVHDVYQLVQTAAGFIYRHEGETDCEDE